MIREAHQVILFIVSFKDGLYAGHLQLGLAATEHIGGTASGPVYLCIEDGLCAGGHYLGRPGFPPDSSGK